MSVRDEEVTQQLLLWATSKPWSVSETLCFLLQCGSPGALEYIEEDDWCLYFPDQEALAKQLLQELRQIIQSQQKPHFQPKFTPPPPEVIKPDHLQKSQVG
jgi:hypothetical protein